MSSQRSTQSRFTFARCLQTLIATIGITFSLSTASSAQITEYGVSYLSVPEYITSGPDGRLWFTDSNTGYVWNMTTSGVATAYAADPNYSEEHLSGIVAGPDGALWFGESNVLALGGNRIGRMTTDGQVTQYVLPGDNKAPQGFAVGKDGAIWFSESYAGLGRITTSGEITEIRVPSSIGYGFLGNITVAADGTLWMADLDNSDNGYFLPDDTYVPAPGQLLSYNPNSGQWTAYSTPTGADVNNLTLGPDGAVWFTEAYNFNGGSGTIGRIDPSTGNIIEYPIDNSIYLAGITTGADGNLWFTDTYANDIGSITTSGVYNTYALPNAGATPNGITLGPDNNLWWVERGASEIGTVPEPGTLAMLAASLTSVLLLAKRRRRA